VTESLCVCANRCPTDVPVSTVTMLIRVCVMADDGVMQLMRDTKALH